MDKALALTVYTAIMVGVSGLVLGLWQILSAPDQPNYPTSGTIKRFLMFWFMAALLYRSIEILYGAYVPDEHGQLVRMKEGSAVVVTLMAALFTTFLVDHCRNWLPKRTHQRIRQLLTIARCRPSKGLVAARTSAMASAGGGFYPSADVVTPALIELHMQGVRVAGPNEGPGAFTDR